MGAAIVDAAPSASSEDRAAIHIRALDRAPAYVCVDHGPRQHDDIANAVAGVCATDRAQYSKMADHRKLYKIVASAHGAASSTVSMINHLAMYNVR
jgi:hypothetical protein